MHWTVSLRELIFPPQNSIYLYSSLNPTIAAMIPLSADNNGWFVRSVVAKESWESQARKVSTCTVRDTCGVVQMLPSACEVHETWCARQRARVCNSIYWEPLGKKKPRSTGLDILMNVFFCHLWHTCLHFYIRPLAGSLSATVICFHYYGVERFHIFKWGKVYCFLEPNAHCSSMR